MKPAVGEPPLAGGRSAVALPVAAFLAVAWLRLWGLDRFEPSVYQHDEGIRLEQLSLMTAGFRPFQDIYASQGPLLLDAFYPFFDRFGRDVLAARLPAALGSLACLVGLYLAARRLGGRTGALTALVLLGVSPWFLSVSRLALAEVPSMGAGCIGLWLALRYRDERSRAALFGSALCLAFATLLKPMAAVMVVPVLVALLYPDPRRRIMDGLDWCLVAGASTWAVLVLLGLDRMYEHFVAYRAGAAGMGALGKVERWSVLTNLEGIRYVLRDDLPLIGLALAGLWLLARGAPLYALVGGSWLGATTLFLVAYSPIAEKHVAYLLPPAALLAGGGVDSWLRLKADRAPARRLLSLAPLGVAALWYLASLANTAQANWRYLNPDQELLAADSDLSDALDFLGRVTGPEDYLVVDHPYLAFLAGRRVPPRLVDLSRTRILARALTDEEALAQTQAFDAKAVVFWGARLELLRPYSQWVEQQYVLARSYEGDRAIYIRREAAPAPPAAVEPPERPDQVRFGQAVELAGFEVAPFDAGRVQRLSLRWLAVQPELSGTYAAQLALRRADGSVVYRRSIRLLPSWSKATWSRGLPVDRRVRLDLHTVWRGEYLLTLAVTGGGGAEPLPVTVSPTAAVRFGGAANTVVLGLVSVG